MLLLPYTVDGLEKFLELLAEEYEEDLEEGARSSNLPALGGVRSVLGLCSLMAESLKSNWLRGKWPDKLAEPR